MEPIESPKGAVVVGTLEMIALGQLDRYLIRFDAAIRERMRTAEWLTHTIQPAEQPHR